MADNLMKSAEYQSAAKDINSLGSVIPAQLAEYTTKALFKLNEALGGDVTGYVAKRLHMSLSELRDALAAEQVDGVALAMYNIEKRAQSVIIGDQTGIGKGRQAAAMIRYGLLSGYLPIFFTDRYTLFSDMYRDCKALGIKDARPLVVNARATVVDFDSIVEEEPGNDTPDDIWSPDSEEDMAKYEEELMGIYQKQYEVVYKAPKKELLQKIFKSGDIPSDTYEYIMITYSQLKDAKRDITRLDFLQSLCEKHRVLFIFDEAHRSSSVSAGNISVITQGINKILTEANKTQCVFLSATFAKRPESLITFMRRTALSALVTEDTLAEALHSGGVTMQEYVSSCLASEGQMIRREHSTVGIPTPVYTYLDDELALHGELFDKVMLQFRDMVKLSALVHDLVNLATMKNALDVEKYTCYPTRAQLFYINKVLLLSLKAQKVAQVAVEEVRNGKSVVIGMSDTLECVLRDVIVEEDDMVCGDFSALLLRLLEKTVRNTIDMTSDSPAIFNFIDGDDPEVCTLAATVKGYYQDIKGHIAEEIFHLPMSPIDVIRQLITREEFIAPDGNQSNIRFEECTGRAHQLEYLSPDGDDDFKHARIVPRKKRHSNHIFNDFQNNKLDVILINACGAIGASAHAISTAEVPENQVRQRKMLIVQNDLDVNIDLQKRGRINRTGQRMDLPPLYEYIITAIPSEKRLNMILRAKLRSLSANTAGWQDQDKEQADFVDISNKYGNEISADYLSEHPELTSVLGLTGKVTASRLLGRIAMLSVTAQQDIVDDLMAAYTNLEAELRRINQWDLERDYRDFEAEFVRDELFTTAKAETRLGGCSYLTTYRCKQKTFPYSYNALQKLCGEAKERYGTNYNKNTDLQKQIQKYYSGRSKSVRSQFEERRTMLHDNAKRVINNYCHDETLAEEWLKMAQTGSTHFEKDSMQKNAAQIKNKLISYSNEYNHLIEREKKELRKYTEEKKQLIEILTLARIGKGYDNICVQLANEECPDRVIAVLRDIRFGKDEKNRFLPSQVEFVFALSAVCTEIHINMVHNKKWSNYRRLREILLAKPWISDKHEWDLEIARNNNKIVERKIITGNILGAYVHPAIAELKPRFITFTLKDYVHPAIDELKPTFNLKDKVDYNVQTQIGLLLPMDESKIRKALSCVSLPLHEGMKYATNTNTSYTIAGLEVNFSLLPYRAFDESMKYVISVSDNKSADFEKDNRFDDIRSYFVGKPVKSIYDKKDMEKKKRKPLMHYQTEQMSFESEPFQTIIQTLAQLDAMIIVPRDQISYGYVKELISRSEREDSEPWDKLDWKNDSEVPMPPVKDNVLLRISAPLVQEAQKGKPVFHHSELYLLAKETMELQGSSCTVRSTKDALRRLYMKWKTCYGNNYQKNTCEYLTFTDIRLICGNLRYVIENGVNAAVVDYSSDVRRLLQKILDSEYLDQIGQSVTIFDEEMLFFSPDKAEAQAFLDQMPCSPRLNGVKKCIEDYISGKTDIIKSPEGWEYELYRTNWGN